MDRVAFNAMVAQYATPEVSGDGRVSWDKGVRCVMPEVKLYGKCEQETLTGKNLADVTDAYNSNGGTKTSTRIIPDTTGKVRSALIPVEAGETYFISFSGEAKDHRLFWFSEKPVVGETISIDGIYSFRKDAPKTAPANAKYLFVIFTRDAETYISGDYQVELGSTATAYEPYCGGIPAPNPNYPMPIKCNNGVFALHGDTILSTTQLNTQDFGWKQNANKEFDASVSYYYYEIQDKPNTTYYCIAPYAVFGDSAGYTFVCTDRTGKNRRWLYTQNNQSLCKTALDITTDETGMLYLVTTSPYNAQNVLRSFWLTEYCGQATAPKLWAAPAGKFDPEGRPEVHDEWNPQTGYGLRRIKKIVFYGTELFSLNAQILQLSGKNAYQCSGNFGFKQSSQNGICSHFEIWPSTGFFRKNTVLVLGSNVIAFMTDGVQTIDEFKTWLAEQAAAGTPVTLWTYVAEPEPFYTEPQKLTQPNGPGQIIQVSGSVPDCHIEASYLTHS